MVGLGLVSFGGLVWGFLGFDFFFFFGMFSMVLCLHMAFLIATKSEPL